MITIRNLHGLINIYKFDEDEVNEDKRDKDGVRLLTDDVTEDDIFDIIKAVIEMPYGTSINITKNQTMSVKGSKSQEMNEVHHGIIEQWKEKGWV